MEEKPTYQTETEVIADEGPCACDPRYRRSVDTRTNERRPVTRKRYTCTFCQRRWTMYELPVVEMERLWNLEQGVKALLKAIGK